MKVDRFTYFIFLFLVIGGLTVYHFIHSTDLADLYSNTWPMAVTMIFGAFIAGASSEGGGAIAFPVMTLILNLSPSDARIFSLSIQSFGMTAASLLIVSKKIPIVSRIVIPVSVSGIAGFICSDLLLVPLLPAASTKLFFVSLWLSFGFALWLINRKASHLKNNDLPGEIGASQILLLVVFGFIGGATSSVFGNGIDIVVFTLLALYFRIDEKVATPTSVVLMTMITIFGFLWHLFFRQDISSSVQNYLVACIPIVVFMAPLGAFAVSKVKRQFIAYFLYFVIVAQFITAMYVVKPGLPLLIESGIVFTIGILIFVRLSKAAKV